MKAEQIGAEPVAEPLGTHRHGPIEMDVLGY